MSDFDVAALVFTPAAFVGFAPCVGAIFVLAFDRAPRNVILRKSVDTGDFYRTATPGATTSKTVLVFALGLAIATQLAMVKQFVQASSLPVQAQLPMALAILEFVAATLWVVAWTRAGRRPA